MPCSATGSQRSLYALRRFTRRLALTLSCLLSMLSLRFLSCDRFELVHFSRRQRTRRGVGELSSRLRSRSLVRFSAAQPLPAGCSASSAVAWCRCRLAVLLVLCPSTAEISRGPLALTSQEAAQCPGGVLPARVRHRAVVDRVRHRMRWARHRLRHVAAVFLRSDHAHGHDPVSSRCRGGHPGGLGSLCGTAARRHRLGGSPSADRRRQITADAGGGGGGGVGWVAVYGGGCGCVAGGYSSSVGLLVARRSGLPVPYTRRAQFMIVASKTPTAWRRSEENFAQRDPVTGGRDVAGPDRVEP